MYTCVRLDPAVEAFNGRRLWSHYRVFVVLFSELCMAEASRNCVMSAVRDAMRQSQFNFNGFRHVPIMYCSLWKGRILV